MENCSDQAILSMVDLSLARHVPMMRVRWLGSMAPKLNATRKRLAELEAFHETEPLVGEGAQIAGVIGQAAEQCGKAAGEVTEFVSDEAVREIVMREIDRWLSQREAAPKLETV